MCAINQFMQTYIALSKKNFLEKVQANYSKDSSALFIQKRKNIKDLYNIQYKLIALNELEFPLHKNSFYIFKFHSMYNLNTHINYILIIGYI